MASVMSVKKSLIVIMFLSTICGVLFYKNTTQMKIQSYEAVTEKKAQPKENKASKPSVIVAPPTLTETAAETMKKTIWPVMASKEELDEMDLTEISELYHGYVNSIQVHCKNRSRVGNWGDGGWDVCMDVGYRLRRPCIVYSFGINYEWSFDDAVSYHFGCDVYAFDPSMSTVADHDRGTTIHFRKVGLNGTNHVNDKGWKLNTFSKILKQNKHTDTVIDVLKVDVEGSEWHAFPQMISDGSLKNVKQFCFEIHLSTIDQPKEDYSKGLDILTGLYKEGFRIFHTNRNLGPIFHPKNHAFGRLFRSLCHELCMMRMT